ncbi:GntR family transcriptional regulator [Halioglobus maricola]|uniref:GntR family transcriptional regulator n=1 Tax=Halioglobus maricola TaxID=2601894 RepID=A0A5P9NIR0_9GAMM|nr:GntR family transcriptional regulator [Halioglobus maricola]QFU75730.1 GntR family transcriptional regulator [Halioglobus maricola]
MKNIGDIFSEGQLQALNQEAPTPLYFRLYTLLKDAILNGTIDNGAQMPTEQQLAETFGVSRITAKRAMDELAAESLVERRRGRGTHVTYEYSPQPVQAPLVGMLQEIESMARHSDVHVLECKSLKPPASVREALNIGEADTALHVVRVRSRDGLPFGYYSSWTAGLAKAVTKRDFENAPRLEIFRKHGLAITHVSQTISALAATPDLAAQLDTQPGAPLLNLVRLSYERDGDKEHLVDYLKVFYHPERFKYRMDLKVDN